VAVEAPRRRVSSGPLPGSGGKVIRFPIPVGAPVEGPHALAPEEVLPLTAPVPTPPSRRSPESSHRVRWFAIAGIGLLAVVGMALVHWYVKTTATWVPPAKETASTAAAHVSGSTSTLPAAPVMGEDAVYDRMEDEIRADMMMDFLDVAQPGDLEDVLLIELRKVHVDVVRVDANVVTWTGRHKDVPQVAEIRIRFRSHPEEIDRELAAIAMVVGKYVQHFNLEVPRFEVVFDGIGDTSRRQILDPEKARQLYLQRISMLDFLAGATASPAP